MQYEVKPENIEAVLYDGTNLDEVIDLLGKYLVKETEDPMPPHDKTVNVFDISVKTWFPLHSGFYVVLDSDGGAYPMRKDHFEEKFQPAKPVDFGKWSPQPTPMPYWPRIADGPRLPNPTVTVTHDNGVRYGSE